jgi:hypothetical protein
VTLWPDSLQLLLPIRPLLATSSGLDYRKKEVMRKDFLFLYMQIASQATGSLEFTHFIFLLPRARNLFSCWYLWNFFIGSICAQTPEILIFLRPSRILLLNVEQRNYVTGKGPGGYFDMNLSIDSYSASFDYNRDGLLKLIDRLERLGYKPLVRKAAREFANIFGGDADNLRTLASSDDNEERLYTGELNRRRLLTLEKHGYDWNIDGMRGLASVPEMSGELFFTDDGNGVLFISIVDPTGISIDDQEQQETNRPVKIRAGLIGDSKHQQQLSRFLGSISEILFEDGAQIEWDKDHVENDQFKEFLAASDRSSFTLASAMSEQELKSAKALENSGVRDVALDIRKAGVILAKDLLRQKPDMASETVKCVDQLLQSELLRQEYVVICSKTGAHVNRVASRHTVEQLAMLGVLCSCGKHISEEPMEGLLSSEPLLQKMLDRNYWLTASIVRVLTSLGVPTEKIILNSPSASDDVEIISDVDGSLLMFELKDNEFGFAQALQFGTRVGMHHPDLAFIVSTRGIAPEVKDHFKRVKIDTQMVYITNLIQLESTLTRVVEGFRLKRIKSWFNAFQSMLNFGLSPLMMQRLVTSKDAPEEERQAEPAPLSKPLHTPLAHADSRLSTQALQASAPSPIPFPAPAAKTLDRPVEPMREPVPAMQVDSRPSMPPANMNLEQRTEPVLQAAPQPVPPPVLRVEPAPASEPVSEYNPAQYPNANAQQLPTVPFAPTNHDYDREIPRTPSNGGGEAISLRDVFRTPAETPNPEPAERQEAFRMPGATANAEPEAYRMPAPAASPEPVAEREAFRMPAPAADAEPVAEREAFRMPAPAADAEPVAERETYRMPAPAAEIEPVAEREAFRMPAPAASAEPVAEREAFRMPAPVAEVEPVAEREAFRMPEVNREAELPEPVAYVEPRVQAMAQAQPEVQPEPIPQLEPVAKAEPFVVPVPQLNVEDAMRSEPLPVPAQQPVAAAAPGASEEDSQSAWNSLSSILSSVAAKEGGQAEVAQPQASQVPPVPPAPPAIPAPAAASRQAAAGLKLSLFSDDDDEEFTRPAQPPASAPAAVQLGDPNQAQDPAHVDDQDETAKRQSRLAAIRGLRGA